MALAAQSLAAQGPDTLVIAGETTARALVVRDLGYAAYPITVLEALGAEIVSTDERVEVKLFGNVLWFRPGYGTFAVNGTIHPLHRVAFQRNGVLHLPEYFFLDWLPARYRQRVEYDGPTARLGTPDALARATRLADANGAADAPVEDGMPWTTPARAPAAFDEPAQPSERPEPLPAARSPAPVALQLHLRLSGSYFDNFFQAPVNGTETDLLASTAEARLVLRLVNPQATVYARATGTAFDGFEPSAALLGGFDWSGGRHGVEASAGYQQRNPRLHAGDQPGFADILHGTVGYAFLFPGNVQLSALGQYYDVTVIPQDANHRSYGAGAALRYRGFGYRFSPEVGATASRWNAPLDADQYGERVFWLSLRAVPAAPIYLHARYRRALRAYRTADPAARNFGREDTRQHWTVVVDLSLSRRLSWGWYYTYETVQSARADRDFSTQSLTSGLSLRVW